MTRAVDSFELHFDWMNRIRDVTICFLGTVLGWSVVQVNLRFKVIAPESSICGHGDHDP